MNTSCLLTPQYIIGKRGVLMNQNFTQRLKDVVNELNENLKSYNAEKLEVVSVPLNDIRNEVREIIQENLRPRVEVLIQKLKHDESVTSQEMQLIEKWIIGDADYYTRIENNMIDWIAECKRLCTLLADSSSEGIEKDDTKLFAIGALLTDLKYTLTDVIRYSEAMNRVDRFKSTIGAGMLNTQTRRWLAELMEQQLASDEF